ncbi:Glycerol-3-phosphate acyltransferase 9 [Cucumispora dikerogammari]|nr:Glycerol-3-phosphate acyltransferase 9 [Cucumispora dikerogammari]
MLNKPDDEDTVPKTLESDSEGKTIDLNMQKSLSKESDITPDTCFIADLAKFASLSLNSIKQDVFSTAFVPKPVIETKLSTKLYIYLYLLPLRIIVLTLVFIPITAVLMFGWKFKEQKLIAKSFMWYSKIICWAFGANIRNHGFKSELETPHLFVSNHSSFLDYLILSSHKFGHAVLVENHAGLFNFFFRVLERNGSLAFKRYEKKDKQTMKIKLIKHIKMKLTPMLIFPEGVCVNNTATIMFQKGAFDLGVTIIPVTIKYTENGFDPYWNRRNVSFIQQLFYLLTTISFDVDVYYNEPIKRNRKETASDFAMRCKAVISEKGNLKSLKWDGYLKNSSTLKADQILMQSFLYSYCSQKDFINVDYDEFMEDVSNNYLLILNNKLKFQNNALRCSCCR